ncbi:MAG: phosphatase PAP2 family protein [Mycobacterium sp.]
MSDVRSAVREAGGDVVTNTATGGLLVTALLVAALLLGAQTLPYHRYAAAGMRVAGLLMTLTALTIGVQGQGWVTGADAAVTSWFVAHRFAGFDVAALVITDLASPVGTAVAAVMCGALLSWRARSMIPGGVVIGTVAAAALASTALKVIVGRSRPPLELQLVLETDHSFPSGHVTGTTALLGIIAVCAGTGCRPAVRAWLAAGVVTGVLAIAATRLYLGVHWLTDVAAGAILGAAFVTLGGALYGALHARPAPDETPPGGTRVTAHR